MSDRALVIFAVKVSYEPHFGIAAMVTKVGHNVCADLYAVRICFVG
ncbi:hypothetical protein RUM8411_01768 [Ruegeria meonggei]|uniref:Uncharacterized protein n=1 Tax=Ruegeria meonggei TaxID=1446476 RepID=A0A1X6Z383_9RHOB|nr:hypothetical protein RUM8411_01768 [Ruegeria meonggei]